MHPSRIACFCLLMLFCTSAALIGGEDPVRRIRRIYQKTAAEIERGELLHHQLSLESLLPGSGSKHSIIHFYYALADNEDSDEIAYPALAKAVVEYSLAASVSYHLEFLFDSTQALIFYYSRADGYECLESRFYFDQGRLVKIKVNPLENDCIEEEAEENKLAFERTAQFSAEDVANAAKLQEKARQYLELFQQLAKLDNQLQPGFTFSPPESEGSRSKPEFTSVFRELPGSDCRELPPPAPDGDAPKICPALPGYQLYVDFNTYGHELIRLQTEDGKFDVPLIVADCQDSQLYGEKMEWRLAGGKPFACMVEITCLYLTVAEEDGIEYEKFEPATSYVMIKGLPGFEQIDQLLDITNTPNALEKAREIVDRAYLQSR